MRRHRTVMRAARRSKLPPPTPQSMPLHSPPGRLARRHHQRAASAEPGHRAGSGPECGRAPCPPAPTSPAPARRRQRLVAAHTALHRHPTDHARGRWKQQQLTAHPRHAILHRLSAARCYPGRQPPTGAAASPQGGCCHAPPHAPLADAAARAARYLQALLRRAAAAGSSRRRWCWCRCRCRAAGASSRSAAWRGRHQQGIPAAVPAGRQTRFRRELR